jgi:phosphoribosylglycinamide formyltransferase 1
MKRIVVLISGRGSNMEAVARACSDQQWPARIEAVIADRPNAEGLTLAHRLGLDTEVVDLASHPDRAGFEAALAHRIDARSADLVVLAGFMRILGARFVSRYRGRLLNIHPSLLPAFPGLRTHRQALQSGVRVHGATVHFVAPDVDAGPIVAQAALEIGEGESEVSLAARVLALEHRLLPMAVRWFLEGRLRVEGATASLADRRPGESRLIYG